MAMLQWTFRMTRSKNKDTHVRRMEKKRKILVDVLLLLNNQLNLEMKKEDFIIDERWCKRELTMLTLVNHLNKMIITHWLISLFSLSLSRIRKENSLSTNEKILASILHHSLEKSHSQHLFDRFCFFFFYRPDSNRWLFSCSAQDLHYFPIQLSEKQIKKV